MSIESSPAQTRHRLLAAAAAEILDSGYAAASMSRIGDRLGVTKGALGHHFPAKISIVDALIAYAAEVTPTIGARAAQAFPQSPVRACVMVMGVTAASARTDPVFGAAILAFQDPSIDAARVAPLRRAIGEQLAACLRRSAEADEIAPSMAIDDAVEYLQVVLTGFLSSARFPETAQPHHEPLFMAATLAGIGVGDAATIVDDVLSALSRS